MENYRKAARIRSTKDFQRARVRGKRSRAGMLTVVFVAGDERRIGVVVSRRSGNAVQRNRIKRVIRDYFRRRNEDFPRGDCVVVVSPGAARVENASIRKMLGKAISRF